MSADTQSVRSRPGWKEGLLRIGREPQVAVAVVQRICIHARMQLVSPA